MKETTKDSTTNRAGENQGVSTENITTKGIGIHRDTLPDNRDLNNIMHTHGTGPGRKMKEGGCHGTQEGKRTTDNVLWGNTPHGNKQTTMGEGTTPAKECIIITEAHTINMEGDPPTTEAMKLI